jgi:outer membrane receptor protein involved in Fe transport
MKIHKILSTWAAGIGALSLLVGAFATQALAQEDEEIEEIVVEGSLRSLPTQDVGSVFGFDKSVLETPRSISTISSEQIERFGINDIDDFVVLAPGTFTQSFFGTSGLDVLDNPGNYPTPIGASDRIDIVRGPASPIYGPSKIGGYLNFVPKSARADSGQYLDVPQGKLSYTGGSWDKSVLTAEVGGPGWSKTPAVITTTVIPIRRCCRHLSMSTLMTICVSSLAVCTTITLVLRSPVGIALPRISSTPVPT